MATKFRGRGAAAILAAGALLFPAPPARAGDGLLLELNDIREAGDGCRVSLVMRNGMGVAIADIAFEMVIFDREERVAGLVVLGAGALTDGKTRVRQFDLKDTRCADIARLLVNDVARCEGEALTPAACLDAVRTASRLPVALGM